MSIYILNFSLMSISLSNSLIVTNKDNYNQTVLKENNRH